MTDPALIAEYSGTCPLCTKYITKGRSKIVLLDTTLPPHPAGVFYDAERGHWREVHGAGRKVDMRGRCWAHEKCAVRLARSGVAPELYAAIRFAELAAHKLTVLMRHVPNPLNPRGTA